MKRWNRTLAERLFGHQYAQEISLPSGQSTEWVARLPSVVAALNGEVTRLTGKKPSDAIKAKTLRRGAQKPSSVVPGRPVGLEEQKVPSAFAICTSQASWKVAVDALQTLCGLLRFTGSDAQ